MVKNLDIPYFAVFTSPLCQNPQSVANQLRFLSWASGVGEPAAMQRIQEGETQ